MLNEQRRSDAVDAMDSYVRVTKTVSPDAKNMFAWIEWIVMADLPITVVDNEYDDDDEVHVQESFIRDADDEYEMRVLKKSKVEFPYVDTSHVAGTPR